MLSACAIAGKAADIHGTITDNTGAAIGGAIIIIHWDSSGSAVGLKNNIGISGDAHLTSERNGTFSMSLPSGFYDVFVSAEAFSPKCSKIRIRSNGHVRFDCKLSPDPLVAKELADKVAEVP